MKISTFSTFKKAETICGNTVSDWYYHCTPRFFIGNRSAILPEKDNEWLITCVTIIYPSAELTWVRIFNAFSCFVFQYLIRKGTPLFFFGNLNNFLPGKEKKIINSKTNGQIISGIKIQFELKRFMSAR